MTRKGEKRVSSTPAQNQNEVEEWTGQSPSAESWLVSHQQGSISETERRTHVRWGNTVSITTCRLDPTSQIHYISTLPEQTENWIFFVLFCCSSWNLPAQRSEMEERVCLKCMGTQPLRVRWHRVCCLRGLIQPELCHTKGSGCCADRVAARERERTLREKTWPPCV